MPCLFNTVEGTDAGTTILRYTYGGSQYAPRKASNKSPCEDEDPVATTTLYTITATASEGGSITPPGVVSVPEGGDQIFTLTADAGYVIDELLVDGVATIATGTYQFVDVDRDHTIHASFVSSGATCPVTITPALSSYITSDDVQLSWDSTCYPSSQVMLEVRKVTAGESSPFIMIYSAANNDGDYPYQGFPSGLVGSDEWVVRVTDYVTRTNWDESAPFGVE